MSSLRKSCGNVNEDLVGRIFVEGVKKQESEYKIPQGTILPFYPQSIYIMFAIINVWLID